MVSLVRLRGFFARQFKIVLLAVTPQGARRPPRPRSRDRRGELGRDGPYGCAPRDRGTSRISGRAFVQESTTSCISCSAVSVSIRSVPSVLAISAGVAGSKASEK